MSIDHAANELTQTLSQSIPCILAICNLPWENDFPVFAQLYMQMAASVGRDRLLLDSIIHNEIQNSESQFDTLFRGTNVNITLITCYFQLHGSTYIQKIIDPLIKKIIRKDRCCDVSKNSKKLAKYTKNLCKATSSIVNAIINCNPKEQLLAPIKYACYRIYDIVEKLRPGLGIPSVAAFFMLRLIGPTMTKICVNNNSNAARTLILIMKLLQCMCNNSLPNEEYLHPLQSFIIREGCRLNFYLRDLSSPKSITFSTNITFNIKDCITMVNLLLPYWPTIKLSIRTQPYYENLAKNIEIISRVRLLETKEKNKMPSSGSLIMVRKAPPTLERNLTQVITLPDGKSVNVKSMKYWDNLQLCEWIASIGIDPVPFANLKITGDQLLKISNHELTILIPLIGQRKKLIQLVSEINGRG